MLLSRHTKQREFIAGLGSAAAWSHGRGRRRCRWWDFLIPFQPPGLLPWQWAFAAACVRLAMSRAGIWLSNQLDRLPALEADLVGKRVSVIVATGNERRTRTQGSPPRACQAFRLAGDSTLHVGAGHQSQVAKALGVEIPPNLLATADEVSNDPAWAVRLRISGTARRLAGRAQPGRHAGMAKDQAN
jgi:hypothetical protein